MKSVMAPHSLMTQVHKRIYHVMIGAKQAARFWLSLHDKSLLERFDKGFGPPQPLDGNRHQPADKVLERVIAAFKKGKEDQTAAGAEYAVGPMWKQIVSRNFGELLSAVERQRDTDAIGILESFHRSQVSLGAGGSYDDYLAFRQNPLYRYQFINTWVDYVRVFQGIGGKETELSFSQVGRPAGMSTGPEVIPLEAVRYHYWARRFHALLEDAQRPTICEIGGGLGGQAYKALERTPNDLCYMIFDIPETLLVASYFLLRSRPAARVLLYGEGDLDRNTAEEFDLVLMPNFELPKVPDSSVNLWFNSCSFTEMLRETAQEYLHQIERTCRRFFLHVNHTVHFHWTVGDEVFENLPADELIPDPNRFELVERAPRPFERIEDRRFLRQHNAGHEVFLYQRVS